METLRAYLKTLTPDEQAAFAKRCGTSIGYLRKALSTGPKLDGALVRKLSEASAEAQKGRLITCVSARHSARTRPHTAAPSSRSPPSRVSLPLHGSQPRHGSALRGGFFLMLFASFIFT
jgi:hypothetical protein